LNARGGQGHGGYKLKLARSGLLSGRDASFAHMVQTPVPLSARKKNTQKPPLEPPFSMPFSHYCHWQHNQPQQRSASYFRCGESENLDGD